MFQLEDYKSTSSVKFEFAIIIKASIQWPRYTGASLGQGVEVAIILIIAINLTSISIFRLKY